MAKPTGSPWMSPMGKHMIGQPAIAGAIVAGLAGPGWPPTVRSLFQLGPDAGAMTTSTP